MASSSSKSAQAVTEQVVKSAPPPKEKPQKPLTGRAAVYEANLRGWFTTADQDKDSQLDKKEVAAAIKKLALAAGPDSNPVVKAAAKDAGKNPEVAFIARLDRDGDSLINKREFDVWARDFAEYQAELAIAQQKIADAERRLQEKNISQAMRLQYEAARRNVWASYHALHQQRSYFNHMAWMQRHLVAAAKRK